MPVKIHGRDYLTVAERLTLLRDEVKDKPISITTEKIQEIRADNKPTEIEFKATITVGGNVFTGHAREVENIKNSKDINATSYAEACETSAVGRALAFAGYAGSEIASADELKAALERGNDNPKESYKLRQQLQEAENDIQALKGQLQALREDEVLELRIARQTHDELVGIKDGEERIGKLRAIIGSLVGEELSDRWFMLLGESQPTQRQALAMLLSAYVLHEQVITKGDNQ